MNADAPLAVALLGADGRMGRELIAALREAPEFRLVAALGRLGGANIGRDAGELAGGPALGVALSDDLAAAVAKADVLIDFSAPEGFLAGLAVCRRTGCAFVSGTTGLGPDHRAALKAASDDIAALHASNMTFGMAVLTHLAGEATALLGDEFDVEILEMHHRHKKDAPSGSALALGEAVATARGRSLGDWAEFGRHGARLRRPGGIGFASLRGGDVFGDHSVIFAGEGERLELGFRAGNRRVFARGALRAARWLAGRAPGLYSLGDCLGIDAGRD
ncbi:MAG: 4-hydroxy-tetrahydrodipicolinate reductase [Gammaproteobacteria bacterium]